MNTKDLKTFNYLEDGSVVFSNLESIKTTKELDKGVYNLYAVYESYANKPAISLSSWSESIKNIEFNEKEKIDKLINQHFQPSVRDLIKKLGYYHKVGVLFYGKEGSGKSSIVRNYCNNILNQYNAIVFYLKIENTNTLECLWSFVKQVRKIQPNPIVIVMEELEFLFEYRDFESSMKRILDGDDSIDDVVFFLTTNYVDKIPRTIIDRPSRIKISVEINGISNIDYIDSIITKMIGDISTKDEINQYSKDLKNKTIDEIKDFCLDKIMNLETSRTEKRKIGFWS